MLERSAAYDAAVVGSPRDICVRAVVDISDPDMVYGAVGGSPEAAWSRPEQLHDKVFDTPPRYATLEPGRWLLDGSFDLFPDDLQVSGPVGDVKAALSGPDGVFAAPQVVTQAISGAAIIQAFSLYFSEDPLDGVPEDFTAEVIQGDTAYFTEEITGNHETKVQFKKFTVYDPEMIRVTVTRWTLPGRRCRTVEIIPGIYEDWDGGMLDRFSVTQQGQFSCLTLPYGTAEISMYNEDRRFEPRRKDGLFQSIEARQGIRLYLGVGVPGGVEYKMLGVYYQAGDGWRTGDNAMTVRWSLVDIVGLVADRTFLPPAVLPATLGGWIAAVVGQLGPNFAGRWHVDPAYAGRAVTAGSAEEVTGKKCGDVIRWACQASGTWPRADSETGDLTAEPLWNQGAKVTLDNLNAYPEMRANESLAALIFRLSGGTEFVVSGNATSSEKTVTIVNPFLHTTAQALEAARLILAQYGGNVIETTGRGNPASEIGDVDTIWLDESNATAARRMSQTFQIQNHALQGCRSTLLQADGSYLWTEYAVIRASGKWRAPPGVHQLRIVLGQGGQGGSCGSDGYIAESGNLGGGIESGEGKKGIDGVGGRIWYGVVNCNEEQEFEVHLGGGGAPSGIWFRPGAEGGHTTFGSYSSEGGQLYPGGYTDIANGQTFARTGVPAPLPGTGDGGAGGAGGSPGVGYLRKVKRNFGEGYKTELVVTSPGGPGEPGAWGATGFAMVTWEKPGGELSV